MALVDRVKNILLTPKTEWPVIAGEQTSTADLMKNYVAILAAIPAIAGFIGGSLIGYSGFGISYRTPIVWGLTAAIVGYVMSFIGVIIISHIINALAPTFGGQKDLGQATKVAVYSYTAAWLAGVFAILPGLSILGILGLYSFYLMFVGLPVLMKNPEDKSIGYTVVIVIAAIVVYVVIGAITAAVIGMSGAGRGLLGSVDRGGAEINIGGKKIDTAKLEDFGKKMEEAAAKMEAAQKSGNQEEAMKAAMSGLGTALSGGKSVDPLAIEQLKPFVPETFAGLAKKSSRAEKAGAMGITVSKAEASYGNDAGKNVELTVSDTGGAAGWMAFAGWAMVQGEKEDAYGKERTFKEGNRLVHEKSRKDGGGEFNVVLGERFIVTARGSGVDLNTLKSAVAGLDLAKLEAMKDVGVQK